MTDLELFHHIASRKVPASQPRARVMLLFWTLAEGALLEKRLAEQGIRTIGIYSERQLRLYLDHASRTASTRIDLIVPSPQAEQSLSAEDRDLLHRLLAGVPEFSPARRDSTSDATARDVLLRLTTSEPELIAV